jgi:hypothetical protein
MLTESKKKMPVRKTVLILFELGELTTSTKEA